MKTKISVVATLVFVALLCSCSQTVSFSTRNASWVSVPTQITTSFVEADLHVQEQKVSGICELNASDEAQGFFGKEQMKENAVADALAKCSGDILIEPQFTYNYSNGRLISVEVIGYPAFYRNFHKCQLKDEQETAAEESTTGPQVVVYGAEIYNNAPDAVPAAHKVSSEEHTSKRK